MPVRTITPERSSDYTKLVDDLDAEWGNPQSTNAEPVILIEPDRDGKPVHVYVVWNKWSHVDRVQRSEIIMDAAERRLPQPEVLNITIAMGLTPDEARAMGLKF
jgi:hypothetical protein